MKRWQVWFVSGLVGGIWLSGCQGTNSDSGSVSGSVRQFPASLVGTWKADTGFWEITLGADGDVVSFVNDGDMPVTVDEGFIYREREIDGRKSIMYFLYGPCDVSYDAATRQLSVTIPLDSFYVDVPGISRIDGSEKDYFIGRVSEDGSSWDVRWSSYVYINDVLGESEPTARDAGKTISLGFTKVR